MHPIILLFSAVFAVFGSLTYPGVIPWQDFVPIMLQIASDTAIHYQTLMPSTMAWVERSLLGYKYTGCTDLALRGPFDIVVYRPFELPRPSVIDVPPPADILVLVSIVVGVIVITMVGLLMSHPPVYSTNDSWSDDEVTFVVSDAELPPQEQDPETSSKSLELFGFRDTSLLLPPVYKVVSTNDADTDISATISTILGEEACKPERVEEVPGVDWWHSRYIVSSITRIQQAKAAAASANTPADSGVSIVVEPRPRLRRHRTRSGFDVKQGVQKIQSFGTHGRSDSAPGLIKVSSQRPQRPKLVRSGSMPNIKTSRSAPRPRTLSSDGPLPGPPASFQGPLPGGDAKARATGRWFLRAAWFNRVTGSQMSRTWIVLAQRVTPGEGAPPRRERGKPKLAACGILSVHSHLNPGVRRPRTVA